MSLALTDAADSPTSSSRASRASRAPRTSHPSRPSRPSRRHARALPWLLRLPTLLPPLLAAALILLLAGCGGGGGGDDGTAPPANQAPQAVLQAAAAVGAGEPLALSATGSSDADGDALSYHWNFGDGSLGGGASLAHVYPQAGSYVVRLTVSDGRGGVAEATHTVTVAAPPAAGPAVPTTVRVSDDAGPLVGVSVALQGGSAAAATTGADGRAEIGVPSGPGQLLLFSKSGYADQFRAVQLPAGAAGTLIEVRMRTREAALTLADAAAGGTLAGRDGATLAVPAGALVDGAGNPVSGPVQVQMTPVDVGATPRAFPGRFEGFRANATRGLIESYGTVEFVLRGAGGQPLQVASGQRVTIEIPIYTGLHRDGSAVAAGQTIPLWSLDERSGRWVQEGQGTVVANAASPTGFALRAEVAHLSWWNCDQWLGQVPDDSYNPDVRCCIRDQPNGPCKENSGDICEASGSGGGGASTAAQISAQKRALGLLAEMSAPIRALDTPAQRRPATVATASVPALAGLMLPMPADMDILLEATARNGTYRGTRIARGGRGVRETLVIDLLPVAGGGGGSGEVITLPWQQDVAMQAAGEVDRYRLTLPAGPGFELRVARSGSNLNGSVRVLRPDASVAGSANFGATPAYLAEATVAAAGEYTIEVSAGGGTPGAYRLEVLSFGACASVQAAPASGNLVVNLDPRQARCYDLSLAADEVVRIVPGSAQNGISGSLTLGTEGGVQQLVSRNYPGAAGTLLTGVAATGTYRLRVTNTTLATGSVTLALGKPAAQVLTVPSSLTFTDLVQGTPRLVLLKPPAGGLFHVMLEATGVQAGVQIDPAATSFLAGCASCSTPTTDRSARAVRTAAPALPVLTVFRNAGGAGAGTVVVSGGAPTLIARDADLSANAGEVPHVHAFEASVGEVLAYAVAQPGTPTPAAAAQLYAPDGSSAGEPSQPLTMTQTGLHTLLVRTLPGAATQATTLRLNNVPAAQALVLTPPTTSQTLDLPLGQVLRYSVDLASGDLVGLSLATPGPLAVSASLAGVDSAAVSTPTSGAGPFSVQTAPRFVNAGGAKVLTLRSTAGELDRARGTVTLGVVKPAAPDLALNAAFTGTLAPGAWTTARVQVPAAGRFLLRLQATTAAPFDLSGTVWAPSSPLTGYGGEFNAGLSSAAPAIEGRGALAAGAHTISVRNANGTATTGFSVALVDLEAPVAMAPGGAAWAGQIDVAAERDYASFSATAGQAFTLRATAGLAGTLRLYKLNPNGDWTNRAEGIFSIGAPLSLVAGVEAVRSFTIPTDAPFGAGTYIVEVEATGTGTGTYSVQLNSP